MHFSHIPVLDHELKALLVKLPWDLEIDNSEFQNKTDIVRSVEKLLQRQAEKL